MDAENPEVPDSPAESAEGEHQKMTIVNCEPTVDISVVQELHQHLNKALEEKHVVEFEGAQIDKIDGAVLQLLAAYFRDAKQAGLKVYWKSQSEALYRSATLLGLNETLELSAQ